MQKRRSGPVLLLVLLLISACDSTGSLTATPTSLPPTPPVAPGATATSPVSATSTSSPTSTPLPAEATVTPQAALPSMTPMPDAKGVAPGCGIERMATSPRDGLSDDLFPTLGNAGYDTQHYDLDLDVDVDSNSLTATTTIQAVALKDLASFNLDFRGLDITNLTVNDTPAKYERSEHELTVTPAQAVKSGASFNVRVKYSGSPTTAERNGSPTEGWTKYNGGIYVAGEPDGASTFYPVNEHPCDKATYTLNVTVPQPYVVASTGRLLEAKSEGSHTTYRWDSQDPVASYLVGLNIARFDLVSAESPGGVPIRSYFPKDISADARKVFDRTPEMVQFLSDIYGPYPFAEYGVVVAGTDLNFALETQTMSLFGANVGQDKTFGDETALHELSHQWFGDSVSLKQWRDIWLNEGFATYSQWLWLEHTRGKQALDDRVRSMYNLVRDEKAIPPGEPDSATMFSTGVYIRGGLTLHALRLEIGDDAFFKTMKTYAARYRHGNASTDDFISVAEEISGRNLQALFDGWLHAAVIPDIPQLGLHSPK